MKICLGIPCNRQIQPKTVLSLLKMVAYRPYEYHFVMATEGYTTAENRNYIVFEAMRNDCTHILMIDDDMTFPPETLETLLSNNKMIVGVDSNSRTLPLSTTVALMDENGDYIHPDSVPPWKMELPEELFKCYSVGGGVLLIDMKVFDVMPKPWFKFVSDEETGKILIGEDGWFCQQAKKAGFDIWCDPTLQIGHIGNYIY